MTKGSGLGDNFYVDQYDLSGDTAFLSRINDARAVLPVTGINKSAIERRHGLRDGGIGWVSWFNDAAGQAHAALKGLPTTDRVCSWFRGTTIGNATGHTVAKQVGYDPTRAESGDLRLAVDAQANGFGLDFGRMLTAGQRTDTAATNGSSLDYGATVGTTAFGLQFFYHLFSVTGTSVTIKVQDAPDNATWADVPLATSGALTTAGAARVATSTTENVDRYLRVVTTGTFSSAVFAVGVTRNMATPVF